MLSSIINRYNNLLDITYILYLGHKGNEYKLEVIFKKENFPHLVGLHELNDLAQLKSNKEAIFDKIKNNKITEPEISKSIHFPKIEARISNFHHLEDIFDNLGKGRTNIYRRPPKQKYIMPGSQIEADYLLKLEIDNSSILHLFLKKDSYNKELMADTCIGVSFFPRSKTDPSYSSQLAILKPLHLTKCLVYYRNQNFKKNNNVFL